MLIGIGFVFGVNLHYPVCSFHTMFIKGNGPTLLSIFGVIHTFLSIENREITCIIIRMKIRYI